MTQTILVVDDEKKLRDLIRVYLEQEGYRVVEAGHGREALYVARYEKPDLIILDLMMPEMGGYDFMRAFSKEAQTPVIMLTAKVEDQDKILGLELGAGALAQDQLAVEQARNQPEQATWRRPAATGLGARTRDMDQLVEIYAISNPLDDDNYFYVGSATDAAQQVKDYTRTPNAKVSCKQQLDELTAAGLEASVTVLETGVVMREAAARKSYWITELTSKGAMLANQRI